MADAMTEPDALAPCPWLDLAPDGAGLQLEQLPNFHLVRLAALLTRAGSRDYLEPNGLTSPEWRILGLVQRFGPMPFSQVSQIVTLDKAQVSRSVRRLQTMGHLQVDGDPAHAQRLVLSITRGGRQLYQRVLRVAARRQAGLLAVLTPAQREVLWQVLHTLTATVQAGEAQRNAPRASSAKPATKTRRRTART